MRAFTRTYEVTGLNRNLLISRLKRNGVNIIKLKIISDKRAEITIDNKDTAKYFAICKNMWYNKPIKTGGFFAPLWFFKKNAAKVVAVLCFVTMVCAFENVYFGTVYKGDSQAYEKSVQAALQSAGIKKFCFFGQSDLVEAENYLLNENVSFISLTKNGNKIIADLRENKEPPSKITPLQSDLIADEDFKILKIAVYSGTPMFAAGDEVKKGQVIIGAFDESSGERKSKPILAAVSGECVYVFVYNSPFTADENTVSAAVAAAKNALLNKKIFSCESEVSGKTVTVTIKYEKQII